MVQATGKSDKLTVKEGKIYEGSEEWVYAYRTEWYKTNRRTKFPWQCQLEAEMRVQEQLKRVRTDKLARKP